MFVDENLQAVLDSPIGTAEWEQRVASLRADLEAFVTLKDIGPKYLFLLYPGTKGVWEIRSVQEEPSVRVLGLFAARDVFVATNYALREDLGAWQSRAWKDVKLTAWARWRIHLHTYQPIITNDVHAVVSGAVNGKYFKG
ncbi:MAG: hypothetical protein ACOZAM_14475 [Pseudomonadota bacterium]